jgi:hypothetical protein
LLFLPPPITDSDAPASAEWLDVGGAGEKTRELVSKELVPSIDRIAKSLNIAVDGHDFRAGDTSRENNWITDKTGGGYLQGLTAPYGPDIQRRLEVFSRRELEPVLAAAIGRELGGKGTLHAQVDAGVARDAYDPSEARDPQGRWTVGGGTQIEAQAFKHRFGNSTVVDKSGRRW